MPFYVGRAMELKNGYILRVIINLYLVDLKIVMSIFTIKNIVV